MEQNKIIRGSLATIVLQLIENNGKMYGYEMTKAVIEGSRGRMNITEAALYPTLHNLEADGFLTTDSKIVEGRTRKYYKLSRTGKKEAARQLAELEERIADLKKILKFRFK